MVRKEGRVQIYTPTPTPISTSCANGAGEGMIQWGKRGGRGANVHDNLCESFMVGMLQQGRREGVVHFYTPIPTSTSCVKVAEIGMV